MINFTPVFSSILESMVDENGFLIKSDEVNCIECADNAYLVLRIKDLERAKIIVHQYLGFNLGEPLQITTGGEKLCLWMSPDEFLLVLKNGDQQAILEQTDKFEDSMVVVDNSGGYTCLQLSGLKSETLLSHLINYDIRSALPAGKVVATMLMQSPVIIFRPPNEDGSVHLLVRPSFAHYVAKHIKDTFNRM